MWKSASFAVAVAALLASSVSFAQYTRAAGENAPTTVAREAVRDVATGDERLLAVDHPLVPVTYGGGPDVAGVGARARLGDREAAATRALDGRPQVGVLLLVVGVEQDVVGVAAELERHEGAARPLSRPRKDLRWRLLIWPTRRGF